MAKKEVKESLVVDMVLNPGGKVPLYTTPEAAGADLYACIEEDIVLQPHWIAKVEAGFSTAIPEGYTAFIVPRSGLALNYGITVLNTPATIDSDYRGTWGVLLINFSNLPFRISNGDRIAQVVFIKTEQAQFNRVESLSRTERGTGGFGHTGI
jgi:dUTP pyrophosphatase